MSCADALHASIMADDRVWELLTGLEEWVPILGTDDVVMRAPCSRCGQMLHRGRHTRVEVRTTRRRRPTRVGWPPEPPMPARRSP